MPGGVLAFGVEAVAVATFAARSYHRRVIDEGTEFGARVARHLREDPVVWLTTVTPAGAPLPLRCGSSGTARSR
jgi:hypothetical protein